MTKATPAAALHYFYIQKENSLILQSAFEYLVSVADILMSEVSGVAPLKICNIGQIFSRAGLVIDSYFVPRRIIHSSKHILSRDWTAGLNLASDFDAFKFHHLVSQG